MFDWDRYSWIAAGMFVAGIALGVAVHEAFFFLLVGAYLFRPALLAAGVKKPFADERQLHIQYRSGNIALIVTVLALIAIAINEAAQGRPADNYYLILCIGLLAKALVGVVMSGDYRRAGLRITLFIGLLYLTFVGLEHGPSLGMLIEGAPGIAILAVGLLGMRWPYASAVLLALLGIGTLVVFGVFGGVTISRIGVSIILSLPILAAAYCYLQIARQPREEGTDVVF
ncbi:MAG: hypothetical protein IH600_09800 [Bacteroidetes bacterium]|nr:hypothetical protein [Bacteroidota bacterium]